MKRSFICFLVLLFVSLCFTGMSAWGGGSRYTGSSSGGSSGSGSGSSSFSGSGTLTATVLYNGSPVSGAYVYLQNSQTLVVPPMLIYNQNATIVGPTSSNGTLSTSVPAGAYFVAVVKRATYPSIYGPPSPGDYVWFDNNVPPVITVTSGATVALGTLNTYVYQGASGLTISGTVKGASGAVLSGWAVKATNQPCYSGNWNSGSAHSPNECGTMKYPAFTNASGNYSVTLPGSGTYYLYAVPYLGQYVNLNYPGGYPTCTTSLGSEQSTSTTYFYYNCPITVSSSLTGQNIVVPGY